MGTKAQSQSIMAQGLSKACSANVWDAETPNTIFQVPDTSLASFPYLFSQPLHGPHSPPDT